MQSRTPKILIVGGGAAGHAAASELRRSGAEVEITVIDGEPGGPINRTLVTKGVLPGLLEPSLINQPVVTGVELLDGEAASLLIEGVGAEEVAEGTESHDRAHDAARQRSRGVRLVDGAEIHADAVLIATGAKPRGLPASIRVDSQVDVHTVHSVSDAVNLRNALAAAREGEVPQRTDGVSTAESKAVDGSVEDANVAAVSAVIIGAGFIAAEVASYCAEAGFSAVVIGRGEAPLAHSFGRRIGRELGRLHSERANAVFGSGVLSVEAGPADAGVRVLLEDGRTIVAGLLVAAVGASATANWAGYGSGIPVDSRLRVVGSASQDRVQGLYAAGGVAVHEIGAEEVAIDHWNDARDQGTHAARAILSDLGLASDPGEYKPRSDFTLQAYGRVFGAYGHLVADTEESEIEFDGGEGAQLFEFISPEGTVTGIAGLDAGAAVRARAVRLGEPV